MKWAEISIQTTHEATEAVANIFHDLGASGVVIEDPVLINSYRSLGQWDYCELPEEDDVETVTIKAYLPVDENLDEKLRIFEESVNILQSHNINKGRGTIKYNEVQEADWANSWKEHFHPVKTGETIVIKPSWENYEPLTGELIIELDPGMAFGTGTHPTTTLCIRCLEELINPDDIVFDVGTGSGVLAVSAAKLGAKKVYAVDIDQTAVRVARENVEINECSGRVTVDKGDLVNGLEGKADIIVANIIADTVIKLLKNVDSRLQETGALIASGIIVERLSEVTTAVLANGLIVDKVIEEGGWVAMVIRKGGA